MLNSFDQWLRDNATTPTIVFAAATLVAGSAGFHCRKCVMGDGLDSRWWYTAAQARELLHHIGPEGCRLYAATQLSLDLVFPLAYSALMAWLLVAVYRPANWLLMIPLLALASDWVENACTAYLAATFDHANPQESPFITMASAVATLAKWALIIAWMLVWLIGLILCVT